MAKHEPRTFGSDFKRFFFRGLVVLLPSVLTLWIVFMAYQFVNRHIAEPINRGVRIVMVQTAPYAPWLQETFDPTENELNAAMADAAIDRRVLTRESVREIRETLWQQLGEEPTENQVNEAIAEHREVAEAISRESMRARFRSENIRLWWHERPYMNLIGLIVAIVSVYIAGRLLGGYFGRKIYERLEALIAALPIIKQVYPHVKQIVDFLFEERQFEFNRVVVVQYPRKGIWSLGLVTGSTLQKIAGEAGDDQAITIFIPSSPTPFTGYTITVPRRDAVELPITVDEALRFTVSAGVLVPPHQQIPQHPEDQPSGEQLEGGEQGSPRLASPPGPAHAGGNSPAGGDAADAPDQRDDDSETGESTRSETGDSTKRQPPDQPGANGKRDS